MLKKVFKCTGCPCINRGELDTECNLNYDIFSPKGSYKWYSENCRMVWIKLENGVIMNHQVEIEI